MVEIEKEMIRSQVGASRWEYSQEAQDVHNARTAKTCRNTGQSADSCMYCTSSAQVRMDHRRLRPVSRSFMHSAVEERKNQRTQFAQGGGSLWARCGLSYFSGRLGNLWHSITGRADPNGPLNGACVRSALRANAWRHSESGRKSMPR